MTPIGMRGVGGVYIEEQHEYIQEQANDREHHY